MRVTHEMTFARRCPVDDALDHYELCVETTRTVKVEDILGSRLVTILEVIVEIVAVHSLLLSSSAVAARAWHGAAATPRGEWRG